ncbi:hypothetical protein [Segatella sp.]|jgi:hypothetical protein|uniref:hypothetical protein n=1 Tax=Segatella sp. TaxID=2974253 RepID=UPI003078A7C3
MKTITIKIIKKSVMGVVEGLSATIAQHNPDVDFQTVWASDGEEAKLDIYYREAITDLENFLARFSSSTTQQFDLQALADDFSITIKTLVSWPPRLSGVLTNQIQNYLVHAILAGWLSDFPDMNHTDYASMGASDLDAIKEILLKKDFSFAEAERQADDTTKEGSSASDTSARAVDLNEKAGSSPMASARSGDEIGKQENAQATAGRSVDTDEKENGELAVQSRSVDAEAKSQNKLDAEARNVNEVDKDGQSGPKGSERNQDFVSQHFHQDRVDWSGGRPPYELR